MPKFVLGGVSIRIKATGEAIESHPTNAFEIKSEAAIVTIESNQTAIVNANNMLLEMNDDSGEQQNSIDRAFQSYANRKQKTFKGYRKVTTF